MTDTGGNPMAAAAVTDEPADSGRSPVEHDLAEVQSVKMNGRDRLLMLEVGFDRVAHTLQTTFRRFAARSVEIAVEAIESLRFGDFLAALPQPAILYVCRIERHGGAALVVAGPDLVYAAVDILLRSGSPSPPANAAQPFSTVERLLTERIVKLVLADLTTGFQPIVDLQLKIEKAETNPTFLTAIRESVGAIAVRLRLHIDDRAFFMQILFPHASLEPFRDALRQSYLGDKFGNDPLWERHLTSELMNSRMRLVAVLDEPQVPLDDLIGWRPGATLPLDVTPNSPVKVRCGDYPMLFGTIGRHDDRVVVRVDGRIER